MKELLCAGSSALAPEDVRNRLIFEIMTLTEEQLAYVLQHLEEVL